MRLLKPDEATQYQSIIDQYSPSAETIEAFSNSRFAIIAGPTGAGKDTLRNALVESSEQFIKILSTTSRPPRPGEIDGIDYHFRELAFFDAGFREKRFFQAALVHGQQISCLDVADVQLLNENQIGLSILIVQTELQLRIFHAAMKTVFLVPPDLATLVQRMQAGRSLESAELRRRLAAACSELQIAREQPSYFCLINQDIDLVRLQSERYLVHDIFDTEADTKARQTIDTVLAELNAGGL